MAEINSKSLNLISSFWPAFWKERTLKETSTCPSFWYEVKTSMFRETFGLRTWILVSEGPRHKINPTEVSVHAFSCRKAESAWIFSGLLFNTGICFTVCCNKDKQSRFSCHSFILLQELVGVLISVMIKGPKWGFPLWNSFSNCQLFVDLMTVFFHCSKYTACLPNQKRHKPSLTMFLKITVECAAVARGKDRWGRGEWGWRSERWGCQLSC